MLPPRAISSGVKKRSCDRSPVISMEDNILNREAKKKINEKVLSDVICSSSKPGKTASIHRLDESMITPNVVAAIRNACPCAVAREMSRVAKFSEALDSLWIHIACKSEMIIAEITRALACAAK